MSNNLNDEQYSSQDMLMEYQLFVLYQMMAEDWNKNPNDTVTIKKDLNRMNLSAFWGVYDDINKNQILDLGQDTLLRSWSHNLSNIQNHDAFNYQYYESVGDNQVLADTLRMPNFKDPYASYGFFGSNQLPASFMEFPTNNNKSEIIGYWLITDYPLPRDISWPEIILFVALVFILSFTFIIIRQFLAPIQSIITHVKKLKRGTLHAQLPISSNDEFGTLTEAINKMTEDINLLVTQKQNLLIDVSHELKTPLTRLKFIVANMGLSSEKTISLNKEINFLQDMISNMLLSDKLSTPYIEDLEKKEIALKNLIQHACDMFYQIEKKLTITENSELNLIVNVDPYKLSLAIKNLIDNALKYGDPNKLIELSVVNKKNDVEICVTDFGVGIKKEQIDKIIQPLYRGRAAKAQSNSGFGLGLAITKKIVEAHKGLLKIESQEGQGSSFILVIPKGGV
ncbi:HAMP domain-containing histidine kinase [bacterium]|nr:HAMP domain-containing histidine kinase [bacterium]